MSARVRDGSPGRIGFLEAMVALALVGVMALVTLPWLFAILSRARLTRAAHETSEMIELAKLQARKLGLRTHVVWDAANGRLLAFVDADLDGRYDPAGDYPVGPPYRLPEPVELRGPGDAAALGEHAIVGFQPVAPGAPVGAIFLADGSPLREGAFRFADPRGNILEVRLRGAGDGTVEIRKWTGGGDLDSAWLAGGEGERAWRWD